MRRRSNVFAKWEKSRAQRSQCFRRIERINIPLSKEIVCSSEEGGRIAGGRCGVEARRGDLRRFGSPFRTHVATATLMRTDEQQEAAEGERSKKFNQPFAKSSRAQNRLGSVSRKMRCERERNFSQELQTCGFSCSGSVLLFES